MADLAPDFGKLETKKDAIFEQGRKEGFNDMEIGDMIRSKMQEHYSDRTIRRILPDTAKHTKHASEHKTQPAKMSGSEREPLEVPADKVKIEPAPTIDERSPEEQRLAMQQYEETVAQSKQQIDPVKYQREQEQKSSHPLSGQPQTNETQGRHNIAPEDYDLDHLHEYDKELLARIVYWLDTNSSDLSKLSHKEIRGSRRIKK